MRGKRTRINQLDVAEAVSDKAKAANSTAELWGLFMTEEILDKIVTYTNQKINETILKRKYTEKFLRKRSHIRHLDKDKE